MGDQKSNCVSENELEYPYCQGLIDNFESHIEILFELGH